MNWIEVQVSVAPEAVEAVSEIYYRFGANGVSIEEPIEITADANLYWDYTDESMIDRSVESKVIAYYPSVGEEPDDKIKKIRQEIRDLESFGIRIGSGAIRVRTVKQEDWENSWKQYFKPIRVTDRIVIKPQWEEYSQGPDELMIQIDPGMAFGTGSHETTSMCLSALERYVRKGISVLDVGTGSGILSIAAALLGAERITGVDLDPVAVEVAKENVALNKVDRFVEILHGDLVERIDRKYEIVVANIIAEAILILLESGVKNFVKDDGLLICSGIILEKEAAVIEKLQEIGFEIQAVDRRGEWVCIVSKESNG